MLRKRRLGRTGILVSELGFGGIPIQRISENRAVKLVTRSIDMGINFIDTARNYTDSEKKIGKAIKNRRDEVHICTKTHAHDPKGLRSDLETSISNLGVSTIDLYYLHGVNTYDDLKRAISPENLDFLKSMKDEDRIRFLGVSSHREEVMLKAIETEFFDAVMFPFNYIVTDAKRKIIPLCQKKNIGFVCMKPFAGGTLDNPRDTLRYVLRYPISTAIPGIALIRELEQNISALKQGEYVTDKEVEKLEAIGEDIGRRFCRGCGYCSPCLQGVEITRLMRIQSFIRRTGLKRREDRMLRAIKSLEGCIECKECEEKCPYNLPIGEMMNEQVEWLIGEFPHLETLEQIQRT
ncbi:MAG: aldo/keto reductase [Candidatus Bathyarchaeota archaeon]|nr:MAG: aldo/keto reductase [Candidatus Bathyarchaeota archaeon]